MQIQKNNAAQFEKESFNTTSSEEKLAAEFGMTVEEYRHQHKNYVDTAKQEMEHRRMPPDPKIGDENEENCTTGAGMMRGGRDRDEQLTETIQAVQYAGPEAVSGERIEEERIALEGMKSQHEQRQHNHEQHDDYQVIEGGRESIVDDNYVQISPYTSSSEQDNERKGYDSRSPNLPAMAEGMRVSYQSKPSPRDQHNMKERGEGASLPSHLNDGSHEHPPNHSPRSSRRRPPSPHCDPHPLPPPDPHHQFTIGSMVCLDVQKGEPLYGVLQWVGTVPDFTGAIAGVELVSDYEKCAYLFNTINRSDH